MSGQSVIDLVLGLVVLGLLIFRQLRPRPVRANPRLLLILLVIGVIQVVNYFNHSTGHAGSAAVIALAGSLVLAAVFGAARAFTVRLWTKDGQPWMQGNVLTAVLWAAALGAHLGYDYLIGQHKDIGQIGTATVVLYLVASLAAQRLVVAWRAQRLEAVPQP